MAKKELSIVLRAKNAMQVGISRAMRSLQRMGGAVRAVGAAMRRGFIAASASAMALAASITVAMKKAEEFNQQIGQIATLTNMSTNAIKRQIRGMSVEFGLAKDELTKGLYDALSAGIPSDNVFSFMTVAARAARAGASTTDEAVRVLTSTMAAFGVESQNAEQVADILFQTVKGGVTTFPQLADSLSNVGAIAAASGISLQDVAAALSVLTRTTPTAQAVTQVRAAIIAMNRELGDGWSSTMSLAEGMDAMRQKSGGSVRALTQLTGRVEGANAILGLTGANAGKVADAMAEMSAAGGAMGNAFARVDSRPLAKLWQALNNVMLTIGDAALQMLGPTLERASRAAASFADRIASWSFDSGIVRRIREGAAGITDALMGTQAQRAEAFSDLATGAKHAFSYAMESAISLILKAAPSIGRGMAVALLYAWEAIKGSSIADGIKASRETSDALGARPLYRWQQDEKDEWDAEKNRRERQIHQDRIRQEAQDKIGSIGDADTVAGTHLAALNAILEKWRTSTDDDGASEPTMPSAIDPIRQAGSGLAEGATAATSKSLSDYAQSVMGRLQEMGHRVEAYSASPLLSSQLQEQRSEMRENEQLNLMRQSVDLQRQTNQMLQSNLEAS